MALSRTRGPLALAVVWFLTGAPILAQQWIETSTMVPWDGESAWAVIAGDIDGDGDDDLFVVNLGLNRLFRNDGNAAFAEESHTLPPHAESSWDAEFADVDHDQDLDLIIANLNTTNRLYLNDGSGVFTDVTTAQLPQDTADCFAVEAGDVNGDTHVDLVFSSTGARNLLYLNNGAGVFADVSATSMPLEPAQSVGLELGDVDGDLDLDVVVANLGNPSGPGDDQVYLNDGFGFFTVLPNAIDPGTVSLNLSLGDLDGDLDLDAVFGTSNTPDRMLLNDGSGVFTDFSHQLPAQLGMYSASTALADVDRDGDLDIYYCRQGLDSLFLNQGNAMFLDGSSSLPLIQSGQVYVGGAAAVLRDFDADGDVDLFFGVGNSSSRLLLNDGSLQFSDATRLAPAWNAGKLAMADLDGDLDLDLAHGGMGTIYANDGRGQFAAIPNSWKTVLTLADLAAVDINGDTHPDLVAATEARNRVFANNGAGVMVEFPNAFTVVDDTQQIQVVDLNGDGWADVVAANATQGTPADRVYFNRQDGTFQDFSNLLPGGGVGSSTGVDVGDVTGDGRPDLLFSSHEVQFFGGAPLPGQDRLYVATATGYAEASHQLPAILDISVSVILGDVDGDGDLDAILGNTDGSLLYRNDGTGVFSDVPGALPASAASITYLVLEDADDDGDLDLFARSGNGDLYLDNDGSGVFTDESATAFGFQNPGSSGPGRSADLVVGDLDQDDDPDVISAQSGMRVMFHTRRHLWWHALPRIGKPVPMHFAGDPGTRYRLFAALDAVNIPLGNLGVLQLSPASLFPVLSGNLDGQGRATVSGVIPNDPALVGFSVHFQALVGLPLHLTNREVETYLDL